MQLSTTITTGSSYEAQMFDIIATGQPVRITKFNANLLSSSNTATIKIYTRKTHGSFKSVVTNSIAWDLILDTTISPNTAPILTSLPTFSNPVNIYQGHIQAFYIQVTNTKLSYKIDTINYQTDNIWASDTNIQLLTGYSTKINFGGGVLENRNWIGVIFYELICDKFRLISSLVYMCTYISKNVFG